MKAKLAKHALVTTSFAILLLLASGCSKTNAKTNTKTNAKTIPIAEEVSLEMILLPNSLFFGKYEVTQAQWEAVMGNNPSRFKGTDNPVDSVSWNDCQEFLRKLNSISEVRNSGFVFRLPKDAEWEHACRAGATNEM